MSVAKAVIVQTRFAQTNSVHPECVQTEFVPTGARSAARPGACSSLVLICMIVLGTLGALGILGFTALPAHAQCTSGWLPGDGIPGAADGYIWGSTMWDPDGPGPLPPRLVVAGGFSIMSNVFGNGVAQWDPAVGGGGTWSTIGTGFTVLDFFGFRVFAVAAGSNGELVAAGRFYEMGGPPLNNIARWNGTAWVPLGAGLNSEAYAVAVLPSGDIVAGGYFTSAGGTPVANIARWNGTTWLAMGAGLPGGGVYALTSLPNGDIIAGIRGGGVYRWNGSAWSAVGGAFAGGVGGPWIYALAVAPGVGGGDIIAGGEFTSAGGVATNRVARWNGSVWSQVGSGIEGTVRAVLPLPNGHIIAAGTFYANVGGLPAARVAEYNPSIGPAGSWSAMSSGLNTAGNNAYGFTLTRLPSGNIFAGGIFDHAGSALAYCAAQWNGTVWSAMAPGLDAGVEVDCLFTAASGDLLAGGTFHHAGWVDAGHIASHNGTSWSASGVGMNDAVRAIAQRPNGDFIVGGDFTSADGVSTSRIARWNGTGYVDMNGGIGTFFNASPIVRAVATLPNGDVVAGGEFYEAGGGLAYFVARWNGSAWSSLDLGVDGPVRALLAMPNGDIIAGGDFMNAGGALNISTPHIARWNGTTWSSLGAGVDGPVYSLALAPGGDIIVGGTFTTIGGAAGYNNIARWNGSGWSPLSSGVDNTVNALTVRLNGDVIAGGAFVNAGGIPATFIARYTPTGWTTLGAGVNNQVRSLALLNNGDLAVGGLFYAAGGNISIYFARYTFGYSVPIIATQPSGGSVCKNGTKVMSVALAPGNYGTVSYLWWRYVPAFPIFAGVPNGTLPSGAIVSGTTTPSITISNFKPQDAGQYYCRVTGDCGFVFSSTVTLTSCFADFNCDGQSTVADIFAFLSAWFAGNPSADFNEIGGINVQDIFDFLAAWFTGC